MSIFRLMNGRDYSFFHRLPFETSVTYNMIFDYISNPHSVLYAGKSGETPDTVCVLSAQRPAWIWSSLTNSLLKTRIASLSSLLDGKKIRPAQIAASPFIACEFENYFLEYPQLSMYCDEVADFCTGRLERIYKNEKSVRMVAYYIKAFENECFGKTNTDESYLGIAERFLQRDDVFAWSDGKRIVSICLISGRYNKMARINYVYTHPEYRRRNYTQSLLSYVCKKLQNDGFTPVLYVLRDNKNALSLYEKLGFKATGEIDIVSVRKHN